MSDVRDLLVEIGTEELPPTALRRLANAFHDNLLALLDENHLAHGDSHSYATPRRLAVIVSDIPERQPDRDSTRRGPALQAAFDDDGKPTKPAEGFARSCGVSVDELERLETDKGSWLAFSSSEKGKPAAELLPELVERALRALPVPKRMRWGASEVEFVRPVHWVVLLHGNVPIEGSVLGTPCGNTTRGHRFHHNEPIVIPQPADYLSLLEDQGMVIADMDRRRDSIREQAIEAGIALGGHAHIEDDLLDEVTALVEWPVAITGNFDERFLEVPAEALVSSMQYHQKFFPVMDDNKRLMPHFITIANIDSKDPSQVQAGNERVIRPRLEDAAFFWEQDRKRPLADRRSQLDDMTFQKKLGSLGEKQRRVAKLAASVAEAAGFDGRHAQRAAELAKCDLLTSMVYEFPELQGIMGRYYASHDGEADEVAAAIDEQYQPRFAGDELPASPAGQALSIADRLDTLTGIFAIGQTPSGDKDPFGLRRASLGVLRIIIEKQLDLDLKQLITQAAANFAADVNAGAVIDDLFAFMMDRLRAYYLEAGYSIHTFESVLARQPARPLDFDQRMQAVRAFAELPEAESLAAANKRTRNILKKSTVPVPGSFADDLLVEPAEQALASALGSMQAEVTPLFESRDYTAALGRLAGLREPVDRFFDDVMVMAEDEKLRNNRLALLNNLSGLFLKVADISRLQD